MKVEDCYIWPALPHSKWDSYSHIFPHEFSQEYKSLVGGKTLFFVQHMLSSLYHIGLGLGIGNRPCLLVQELGWKTSWWWPTRWPTWMEVILNLTHQGFYRHDIKDLTCPWQVSWHKLRKNKCCFMIVIKVLSKHVSITTIYSYNYEKRKIYSQMENPY